MSNHFQWIQKAAQERRVTTLVHFTPAENAQSIFEHGLLSRNALEERNLPYIPTDSWRNDGEMSGVSLSVHGINEAMFASKLTKTNIPWLIFSIDAQVLWTHQCFFSWTNAASSEVTRSRAYPNTATAFKRMFDDIPLKGDREKSHRQHHDIPDNRPTLLDAEVQVMEPISPDLITGVCVQYPEHEAHLSSWFDETKRSIPIKVYPEAFSLEHLSRTKFG